MTTEDKTGDKLVASIRKTKAGAAGAAAAEEKATATEPAAEKPAPRRRAAPKARVKATNPSGAAKQAVSGSYQSPGRIWPD